MILADDLFATIAEAVRRGRGVYDNLRKVILFALPTNFAQGFSIVAAIIIGMPSPLTAMQVLTVNMVTSVTLGIVIALGKAMVTARACEVCSSVSRCCANCRGARAGCYESATARSEGTAVGQNYSLANIPTDGFVCCSYAW
jgi:hypothetical protein